MDRAVTTTADVRSANVRISPTENTDVGGPRWVETADKANNPGGTGMKKTAMLACVIAGVLASTAASADHSTWIVRAGVHDVIPSSSNGSIREPDGTKYDLDISDAIGPTFSVEYMTNENWGVELFAGAPFKHDYRLQGVAGKGQVSVLPPTLSVIWHWNPDGRVRPYLGAGIHETLLFDEKPKGVDLRDVFNVAAVGGLDVLFSEHWFASADLRWYNMDSSVHLDGVSHEIGVASIDPFVLGLMVGYRFGGHHKASYAAPIAAAAPVAAATVVAPPPPARCTDGDGDGVCDSADKCPGTPAGDSVDQYGCSLVSRLALYFDFDSAELRPESLAELERVVQFMNDIPGATALIEGHTDSKGTDDYNLRLSDRRAKAVYDYLASRGVNPARLQSVGKGESQPVADNATDAGRAQNRRVMLIRTDSGR
jgi:OOP family OmpA-OmpF porin